MDIYKEVFFSLSHLPVQDRILVVNALRGKAKFELEVIEEKVFMVIENREIPFNQKAFVSITHGSLIENLLNLSSSKCSQELKDKAYFELLLREDLNIPGNEELNFKIKNFSANSPYVEIIDEDRIFKIENSGFYIKTKSN